MSEKTVILFMMSARGNFYPASESSFWQTAQKKKKKRS